MGESVTRADLCYAIEHLNMTVFQLMLKINTLCRAHHIVDVGHIPCVKMFEGISRDLSVGPALADLRLKQPEPWLDDVAVTLLRAEQRLVLEKLEPEPTRLPRCLETENQRLASC